MPKALPSLEQARELLDYDPDTGIFRWKQDRTRGIRAGAVAGHINKLLGYRYISVNRTRIAAHRLAWFLSYGRWPKIIDHANRDRLQSAGEFA